MNKRQKALTLYDAGGFFILFILFGIPFGSAADYLWNLLILSAAIPHLSGRASSPRTELTLRRKLAYCFFITLLGIIIDWAYFDLTWDTDFFGKSAVWAPAMGIPFQLALLIVPMIMLGLVNFALSYSYLKLERRQAITLGVIMGFFTTPWLLPVVPHIAGWVR
jgi:hypothetical protein